MFKSNKTNSSQLLLRNVTITAISTVVFHMAVMYALQCHEVMHGLNGTSIFYEAIKS